MSRLGSTINGIIVPVVYDSGGLGAALLVGFIICLFSLGTAICLILMDRHADKVDGDAGKMISDEDKFRPSDLKTFKLEFWLVVLNCVLTYSAIFPPMQVMSQMLEEKYRIPHDIAPKIFGIPYFIAAGLSPILGYVIDRVGLRVHLSKLYFRYKFFYSHWSCYLIVFRTHYNNGTTSM